jgi:hypothetical protein
MARVVYESKDNAGHKFWVACYGRYAIRIDANRPGVYPWLISLEGRMVRQGVAPDRKVRPVLGDHWLGGKAQRARGRSSTRPSTSPTPSRRVVAGPLWCA